MVRILVGEIEKLSGLNVNEWAQVRTTLFALDNREYQCAQCLHKHRGRPDEEAMLAASQESKACRTIRPTPFLNDAKREIFFSTCPGNFFFPEVIHWIDAYRRFEAGHLPFEGGYMDQPAKLIELFQVIGAHFEEKRAAERKKLEQLRRMGG